MAVVSQPVSCLVALSIGVLDLALPGSFEVVSAGFDKGSVGVELFRLFRNESHYSGGIHGH